MEGFERAKDGGAGGGAKAALKLGAEDHAALLPAEDCL